MEFLIALEHTSPRDPTFGMVTVVFWSQLCALLNCRLRAYFGKGRKSC